MKAAIFDCDGTLVDGQASICEAMEQAFSLLRQPVPDRQTVRRVVGLSLPQAMRRLLPDADADLADGLAEAYKLSFRAARSDGRLSEPLYDGVPALLEALSTAGWALGIATGKSDRGLSHCLATHGITERFSSLQTADRHPSKPHPAMLEAALEELTCQPEHAVMIGDTGYDMAMARAAGVRAIGVAWGYHTPAELTATGAEFVAPSPAALLEYLLDG